MQPKYYLFVLLLIPPFLKVKQRVGCRGLQIYVIPPTCFLHIMLLQKQCQYIEKYCLVPPSPFLFFNTCKALVFFLLYILHRYYSHRNEINVYKLLVDNKGLHIFSKYTKFYVINKKNKPVYIL